MPGHYGYLLPFSWEKVETVTGRTTTKERLKKEKGGRGVCETECSHTRSSAQISKSLDYTLAKQQLPFPEVEGKIKK